LPQLCPAGGTAVDVGANQGVFAYALAGIADRVVAFEPNPDYASFARWMLRLFDSTELVLIDPQDPPLMATAAGLIARDLADGPNCEPRSWAQSAIACAGYPPQVSRWTTHQPVLCR
jgi:uncharacterized protein YllA (UPF0747 family)